MTNHYTRSEQNALDAERYRALKKSTSMLEVHSFSPDGLVSVRLTPAEIDEVADRCISQAQARKRPMSITLAEADALARRFSHQYASQHSFFLDVHALRNIIEVAALRWNCFGAQGREAPPLAPERTR